MPSDEREALAPILSGEILNWPEEDVVSSGYVVHTLGAALWSCPRGDDWASAVLRAVNLGGDADTTGAVAGGIAGVMYGLPDIPSRWVQRLERPDLVWRIIAAFGRAVNVTLGLPIVRTSVDHGTAFDIAGQGIADASSLVEAVRLAARLVG